METQSVADPLERAREAQRTGNLAQAEALCRQFLHTDPHHTRAWCLLGTVQQGRRQHADAVASFRQAIFLNDQMAEAHAKIGISLAALGKRKEGIESYEQALKLQPEDGETHYRLALALAAEQKLGPAIEHAREAVRFQPRHVEAHTNLGVYLARKGQRDEAIAAFRQALELRPDHVQAWNNLGVALAEQSKRNEAIDCYRKALQFKPDYGEALFNLAVALGAQNKLDEAITTYDQLLHLKPDHAAAQSNLGLALTDAGRFAEAVITLQQAVRLQPNSPESHNNLGLALMAYGRFTEAQESYHEALRLQPGHAGVHNNLGTNYAMRGKPQEALACYAQALRLRPNYPEVRWHRALTWLQMGDYERGWPEYEWRWKRKKSRPHRHRAPLWDGAPFPGRTIVLHGEQGMGDTMQFIRFVPWVKERGGTVIVECPPELTGLLSTCKGIDRLVPQSPNPPPGDLQAPLLSLPMIFRTTLATVPTPIPYLAADPARVAHWGQRLASATGLKIGVFWQGNPKHRWDCFRSFPLSRFAPIAAVSGVQLFSLQKGTGADQLQALGNRFPIVDLAKEFEDRSGPFTDAAAVMSHLDLVIGCDSGLTHLAGALGRPVWVLLSSVSDWRWLREREDSPWYPSVRLFRQRVLHDWEELFHRVAEAVRQVRGERMVNKVVNWFAHAIEDQQT